MYGRPRVAKVLAMHKRALTSTLLATCVAALAAAGPAAAKAPVVKYKGKTDAGTKITFERIGDSVEMMLTYLPSACVSSRTSDTKAGSEAYTPLPIRIGPEHVSSIQQPSSLGYDNVTKNYRATLTKGPNGLVRGKLHLNYMVVDPYFNSMGYLDGNTFICQAEGTFSAKPIKRKRRR